MTRRIGLIGAGDMGARMARRLLAAGHDVGVCERNQAVLAEFRAQGVRCSTLAADVSDGDAVVVMVSTDAQVLAVLGGAGGVIEGMTKEAPPVILIMSTCMPATVRAASEMLAPCGAAVIDAPVSGGLGGAENGTLSIMLGGPDAAIDQVMDILTCLGRNLFRCGELGAGQTTKLINNMIGLTNLFLVSEALDMARHAGLRLDSLVAALDASAGRTALSRNAAAARQQFATWSRSPEGFAALMGIVRKDIGSAAKLAREHAVGTPLLDTLAPVLGVETEGVLERWRALSEMA